MGCSKSGVFFPLHFYLHFITILLAGCKPLFLPPHTEFGSRMKSKKLRIFLYIVLAVVLCTAGLLFYSYQQGGVKNYVPPSTAAGSSKEQAAADLEALSKAVEAYYGMNLEYPDSLSKLQPDFVAKVPTEPGTGKNYLYETNKTSRYLISVSDPATYNLKIFAIENGKIIQQ